MKSKKNVPKQFFKDNPLDDMSTAKLIYFRMDMGLVEEINSLLNEQPELKIEPERLEVINKEKDYIPLINSGEEIVRMMRGNCDIFNQKLLCEKAIEMQDEVVPLVIRRFMTSVQEDFIENAIFVLNLADEKYLAQVINQYSEIRSPYAQSMICIAFGEHSDQEMNDFLMQEYYRFAEEYPDECYAEGPLLALYIVNGKGW